MKSKVISKQKFLKGSVVSNKQEVLDYISNNNSVIELREMTKYSDGTEEVIISIKM